MAVMHISIKKRFVQSAFMFLFAVIIYHIQDVNAVNFPNMKDAISFNTKHFNDVHKALRHASVTHGGIKKHTSYYTTDSTDVCEAFIEVYSDAASDFMRCMVKNAIPTFVICQMCLNQYEMSKSAYTNLTQVKTCADMMEDADNAITNVNDFLSDIWLNSNCSACYNCRIMNDTETCVLSNETVHFKALAKNVTDCMAHNSMSPLVNAVSNTTVCTNCSEVYGQLDELYRSMDEQSSHVLCRDLSDLISRVRNQWTDVYRCHRTNSVDMVPVYLVSAFLALLPTVFYVASKVHGTAVEKKLLKEKRIRDVMSPSSPVATTS